MKKAQFKMKKNSGFSLGELLITVAILVVLMAVALPAVLQTQKNLRQKELDAKAEIIYVAAQNAISIANPIHTSKSVIAITTLLNAPNDGGMSDL